MPFPAPGVSARLPISLLYFCFGLEAWLFTWGRGVAGPYVSPILFCLAGIGIALLGFYLLPQMRVRGPERLSTRAVLGLTVAIGAVLGWIAYNLSDIYDRFPINTQYSDIIPIIKVYIRRWQWGSDPYRDLTPEFGYDLPPTYPPATWFPYLMAENLGFDYRWVAAFLLLMGIGAYWAWLLWLRAPLVETVIKALLPLALWLAMQYTEEGIFGFTVEQMVAGYYLLLGAALLARSPVLIAGALVLCLLSRYALILWVPFLLLVIWWDEGWKRAFQLGLLMGMLLVAGYGWPVIRHHPDIQQRILENYTFSAVNQWEINIDQSTGLPYHLFNGLGFASYFYPEQHDRATLREAILRLKQLQYTALAIVLAACTVGWWWRRRTTAHLPDQGRLFALIALKAYLVAFYAFVQVPFSYLMVVSVFFSLLILLLVPAPWSQPARGADAPLTP